jgi:hypothetical protein
VLQSMAQIRSNPVLLALPRRSHAMPPRLSAFHTCVCISQSTRIKRRPQSRCQRHGQRRWPASCTSMRIKQCASRTWLSVCEDVQQGHAAESTEACNSDATVMNMRTVVRGGKIRRSLCGGYSGRPRMCAVGPCLAILRERQTDRQMERQMGMRVNKSQGLAAPHSLPSLPLPPLPPFPFPRSFPDPRPLTPSLPKQNTKGDRWGLS